MLGFGVGIRRKRNTQVLDVYYPELFWDLRSEEVALIESLLNQTGNQTLQLSEDMQQTLAPYISFDPTLASSDCAYHITDVVLTVMTDLATPVSSVEDAFFRLQLISQRCVFPHDVSLDGLFSTLLNLAWTSMGPILLEDLETVRATGLLRGNPITVSHVDKFPYMVNYHVPSGVRIASGSQVRLGAYLGEGTTVMPAGYINFNAGTKGNAMVEGRISAGVVVDKNSDIGGGASIMGTLSGGNNHVITVGEHCLLGANAGTGISLGKGCTIAAGLYVYAGMKVALYDANDKPVDLSGKVTQDGQNYVKAAELSGKDFLLFLQDSRTGRVVCKPNQKLIQLNTELHQHN
jgi:2,3,4,5-tetrahydropyridine-2-carboxylate N-succinyltransferase